MKTLIIGHGRHGKDTVAELLNDRYGWSFSSSSWSAVEKVILPILEDGSICADFLDWAEGQGSDRYRRVQEINANCETLSGRIGSFRIQAIYDCRGDFRAFWHDAISWYNDADPTRLARDILEDNSIYVGMRSARELHACRNSRVFDHIVWVDRSRVLPDEPFDSMKLAPWMADYVIDNNGTLEQLETETYRLFDRLRAEEIECQRRTLTQSPEAIEEFFDYKLHPVKIYPQPLPTIIGRPAPGTIVDDPTAPGFTCETNPVGEVALPTTNYDPLQGAQNGRDE